MSSTLDHLRRLWDHVFWADALLAQALRAAGDALPEALREYGHLLSAEETWLARLERRAASYPLWPQPSVAEAEAMREATEVAYRAYLAGLDEEGLHRTVSYSNSAGRSFGNTVADILLHLALHGQYHRGKVNLLLRQAGTLPAPVDFIAFLREGR